MLFSSLPFLFYFLPCALGLYFLAPRRLKNAALLLCSLVFYAWGEPRFVLFMAAAILQGYAAARLMERYPARRRLLLTLSAVLSLGLLGYCKYADFLISGFNAVTGLSVPLLRITLPIGISFYTFQILSYVIDVYRGDAPAQRSLIDLAAYIAMFPQLVAGPIVRYTDVAPQLQSRTHTVQDAALGARRFVLGLGKKVLLAAADTFRAAAIDQLQIWADRAQVDLVRHEEGSDPAAVVFDAINAGTARGCDVVICDTAGRLHNKKNLMDELAKMRRIISRDYPDANVESLIVLDGTTGQNALEQARQFSNVTEIDGIVITKLDGTAKGGIAIAIQAELNVPVKFIGIGEKIDDLQRFDPSAYVEALFSGFDEDRSELDILMDEADL